ncbi:hypothetical protein TorRG33x02_138260 [Trema orientale]|uniref:Uncharacterized protein n=1 Tax=Trema orientale TaxID=63057 RepID=A0A2P5EXU7_TREOI|nr:hypothetical protein TorRG33x02_138260 [Trema orientale]
MEVPTLHGVLPESLNGASQNPFKRNVRSKNRSLNLRQLFEEKGRNPLPIKFNKAGGTWRPEFFEYKDLDEDNDDLANMRDSILRTVADIYSNWNTELNEHFKLIGGGKNTLDLAMARSRVPNEMDVATWGCYCDLFDSPEFRFSGRGQRRLGALDQWREEDGDDIVRGRGRRSGARDRIVLGNELADGGMEELCRVAGLPLLRFMSSPRPTVTLKIRLIVRIICSGSEFSGFAFVSGGPGRLEPDYLPVSVFSDGSSTLGAPGWPRHRNQKKKNKKKKALGFAFTFSSGVSLQTKPPSLSLNLKYVSHVRDVLI